MTTNTPHRVQLALIDALLQRAVWAAQPKYALYSMLRHAPSITVQEYSSDSADAIVGVIAGPSRIKINRAMVERSAARVGAATPADQQLSSSMHTTLSAAEQQTRKSGLGLWSAAGQRTVNWNFEVN